MDNSTEKIISVEDFKEKDLVISSKLYYRLMLMKKKKYFPTLKDLILMIMFPFWK